MHTLEPMFGRMMQTTIEATSKAFASIQSEQPQKSAAGEFVTDTRATRKVENLRCDGANWLDFSARLKSHVCAQSAGLADLIKPVEDPKREVEDTLRDVLRHYSTF